MAQEFPLDMIYEVLTRTPLDTLDTCKTVSKRWKELIYSSTFLPFYLKKTGTLFGFFIQDDHISKFVGVDETGEGRINKTWPSGNFKILATCNQGIVCCEKRIDNNYSWWVGKPATKQWKEIPSPNLHCRTIGVVIIVSKAKPLRFKIIRLSQKRLNSRMFMKYACEIFDSRTWNWRETQSTRLYYDELININQPAITIGEFVYWKTSSKSVLAFDVIEQNFEQFSLPQTQVNHQQVRLVEYEGGLGCCFSKPNGNLELWQIHSCDNPEWKRRLDLDIRILEETFTYPNLIGFFSSDTLLMKAFEKVTFFNIVDGTFTSKKIDFNLKHAQQFFQFRSDEEYVECLD